MDKIGFHIDSIKNELGKTSVEWHYDGSMPIIDVSETLWITPCCRNINETHSFILSVFLPIASPVGESVIFNEPVSSDVIDFWKQKFKHLSVFFISPLKVDIFPEMDKGELFSYKNATRRALFAGGGVDSLSTLARMLKNGEKPIMVRIIEDGIEDGEKNYQNTDRLAHSYLHDMSERFDLEIVFSTTNATRILTSLFKYIVGKLDPESFPLIRMPNRRSNSLIVLSYLSFGFVYFFSALSSLPKDIRSIVMGSSIDDCGEWFGMGFNYNNTYNYFGLYLESFIWPSKVSQYNYIYTQFPEFFKWQKTCPNPHKQWCGTCHQCQTSYIMYIACGSPPPFKKDNGAFGSLREQDIRKIMNAYIYYIENGGKDDAIIIDIKDSLFRARDLIKKRAMQKLFKLKKTNTGL